MLKGVVERPVIRKARTFALALAAGVTLLVACSASAPNPSTPQTPTRSLGLALEPGPCVAGVNVFSASAFVSGPAKDLRYLEPADGDLSLALEPDGEPPRPVTLRWLDGPGAPQEPQWNLELTFDSPTAGDCPIRVEFEPSGQAAGEGLGRAVTTVVLRDAPPPPPLSGEQSQ